MTNKRDVFEEVHEAFNADTSHNLARKAVDAVLDLHCEVRGGCYECSKRVASPIRFPSVKFPCDTVKGILKVVGAE
jgi:hypothetical protein